MSGDKTVKDIGWLRRISSFAASRIILSANSHRLFDLLEGKGKKAADVARAAGTDRRATELLLNSLVAIGLLRKSADKFVNDPVASKYLVKGRAEYQGDILDHYDTLWDNWSGLDRVLETGKPYRKSHDHESFILGMHNLASLKAGTVLAATDLKGVKRLLDLGGGPGTYSMAFAKKKIEVTLLDFPATLRISKKLISAAGLEKNIRLVPGDFTKDDWGDGYDMIFISQIFHAYDVNECLSMLRKSHRSLKPGGRVVVQEFFLDETRTSPLQGATFAINMLVNTPAGRTYTPKEMGNWMKKAGFRNISTKHLEETVLLTGAK